MISDERLQQINQCSDVSSLFAYEQRQMARELLSLRKAAEKERYIGVWNPTTMEIAVSHNSGIKLVNIAHWHCHCTMEVIVREIHDHPLVKARQESS